MKKLFFALLLSGTVIAYIVWKTYASSYQSTPVLSTTVQHLGVIMDGNRRWARKKGFLPWIGHRKGVDPVKTTIKFCLEHKISYLTLYAFSLENFKRPKQELDFLFDVLAQEIAGKELTQLFKHGVQVRFVGDKTLIPSKLVPIIKDVEEKTKEGKNLVLTILFCYGGRQEFVAAAQAIARAAKAGSIDPEQFTAQDLERFLWSSGVPSLDLIIRTGGMKRLSNFLPYQSTYSELYFLDCYWPEVTEEHLRKAVEAFNNSTRNFGA